MLCCSAADSDWLVYITASYTGLLVFYLTDFSINWPAGVLNPAGCRAGQPFGFAVSLADSLDSLTDWLVSWLAEWLCQSRFMSSGRGDNSFQTHWAPNGGAIKPFTVLTCFPLNSLKTLSQLQRLCWCLHIIFWPLADGLFTETEHNITISFKFLILDTAAVSIIPVIQQITHLHLFMLFGRYDSAYYGIIFIFEMITPHLVLRKLSFQDPKSLLVKA